MHDDNDLLSALFSSAVVSYAKPFLKSKMANASVFYPTKDLKKKCDNFEVNVHEHLINIRNTVVAHDDFIDIDPRLLQVGVTTNGLFIPTTMIMSNKCISFPSEIESLKVILNHVSATKDFIYTKLRADLTLLRQQIIEHPHTRKKSQYKKEFGSFDNPTQDIKNIKDDSWLELPAPSFESTKHQYKYEQIKVGKDFTDYEKIETPNGDYIEFNK
jgi:hypothetical protein